MRHSDRQDKHQCAPTFLPRAAHEATFSLPIDALPSCGQTTTILLDPLPIPSPISCSFPSHTTL